MISDNWGGLSGNAIPTILRNHGTKIASDLANIDRWAFIDFSQLVDYLLISILEKKLHIFKKRYKQIRRFSMSQKGSSACLYKGWYNKKRFSNPNQKQSEGRYLGVNLGAREYKPFRHRSVTSLCPIIDNFKRIRAIQQNISNQLQTLRKELRFPKARFLVCDCYSHYITLELYIHTAIAI